MSTTSEKDSEKLKEIAVKILKDAGLQNDQKFGSVVAILMIISIVLTAVRILQECNKNRTTGMSMNEKCSAYGEEIKEFSRKKGWFTKLRIKRLLKKELDSEDYNKYGLRLIESILNIGENLRDDEIKTLVENANV